jgi:hypothetical protein
LCIVHCPYQGVPRSICWASTISRSPTESHLARSCGSALYGMRIRDDGRGTRLALCPGQISPGLWLHVASVRSAARDVIVQLLIFRHSSHGHWEPAAAGTSFRSPSQICDSLRGGFFIPISAVWLAVLACQFPTRAAHGKRNETTRRIFALCRAPWSHD